jgi:hypothetical protein
MGDGANERIGPVGSVSDTTYAKRFMPSFLGRMGVAS